MTDGDAKLALTQMRHDNVELYSAYGMDYDGVWGAPGELGLDLANGFYRSGFGLPVMVNLSTLPLNSVDISDFRGNTNLGYTIPLWREPGRVYHDIGLTLEGGRYLRASPDFYNFEMHSGSGFKNWFRNFATGIGASKAGSGIPYQIFFFGNKDLGG